MLFQKEVSALSGVEHIEAVKTMVSIAVNLHLAGSLPRPVQGFDLVRFAHRHHRVAIAMQDKHRRQMPHLLGKVVRQSAKEIDNAFTRDC